MKKTIHEVTSNKKQIETMNTHALSDTQIAAQLVDHWDTQCDNLDMVVTSKLKSARLRALAQEKTRKKQAIYLQKWPMIASSFAVLLLTITLNFGTDNTTDSLVTPVAQSSVIEDINLLSASEEIEFYESMEFLEWLEKDSG